MASMRKWLRRGVLGLVLVITAAGVWAGFNYDSLNARYAAHKLKTAASDEERAKWADQLASQEAGLPKLLEFLRGDDPALCAAVAGALERRITSLPEGDARAAALCHQVLDAFPSSGEPGKRAVLSLTATMLKRSGTVDVAKCRTVVAAGLAMPVAEDRLVAVRLAMHPSMRMRTDLVSMLNAPEAEIRRAALFAVGPATDDEIVIGDEELFRWLHDPDAGVRAVCRDALASRGRTDAEISLARRLSHPDPAERLKLLLDLRYDDDVSDPEPWLERLSRDAEPGVRAGAVRVAVEVAAERRLPAPVWVGRLADSDSSLTVRCVASFYRAQPTTKPGSIQQIDGRIIP